MSGVLTGSGPSSKVSATDAFPVTRRTPYGPTVLAGGVVTSTVGPKQPDSADECTDVVAFGVGVAEAGVVSGTTVGVKELLLGNGAAAARACVQPAPDSRMTKTTGSNRRTEHSGGARGPLTIRET
jgi:hypothetical protein